MADDNDKARPTFNKASLSDALARCDGMSLPLALAALLRAFYKTFGNANVASATKTPFFGSWNVKVIATAVASAGEALMAPPTATIFHGNTPLQSKQMSPVPLVIGTWVADFSGVLPEPLHVKVTAMFVTSQYGRYEKSDVLAISLIVAP